METHTCAIKDDMADIFPKLLEANVILLASPVYFYSVSAQMKALIDRCLADHKSLAGKQFYFIITAADPQREAAEGTRILDVAIPDLFAVMNTKQIYHDWNADYYYNMVHTGGGKEKASECIKCGKRRGFRRVFPKIYRSTIWMIQYKYFVFFRNNPSHYPGQSVKLLIDRFLHHFFIVFTSFLHHFVAYSCIHYTN